jgi:hypothetical protein
LATTEGFRLAYSDAAQMATVAPSLVKSISVTIRGTGVNYDNSSAAPLSEVLSTQIALKNAQY